MSYQDGPDHTARCWVRLAEELDALNDNGMGAMVGMTNAFNGWRPDMPDEVASVIRTVDAFRAVLVSIVATRKGLTPDQIEAAMATARVLSGGDDG